MSTALKSFRLGTEMVRRGADLSHLPAPVIKDLVARGLAPKPDVASADASTKRKAAPAAATRRKTESD